MRQGSEAVVSLHPAITRPWLRRGTRLRISRRTLCNRHPNPSNDWGYPPTQAPARHSLDSDRVLSLVKVQDDRALVHIQPQTAQTRDLMDASLLRLRDALQDAGYSQVDVQVSHREQSMEQGDRGTGGGFSGQASVEGSQESEVLPAGMSRREIELTARLQGRIDYFA